MEYIILRILPKDPKIFQLQSQKFQNSNIVTFILNKNRENPQTVECIYFRNSNITKKRKKKSYTSRKFEDSKISNKYLKN